MTITANVTLQLHKAKRLDSGAALVVAPPLLSN